MLARQGTMVRKKNQTLRRKAAAANKKLKLQREKASAAAVASRVVVNSNVQEMSMTTLNSSQTSVNTADSSSTTSPRVPDKRVHTSPKLKTTNFSKTPTTLSRNCNLPQVVVTIPQNRCARSLNSPCSYHSKCTSTISTANYSSITLCTGITNSITNNPKDLQQTQRRAILEAYARIRVSLIRHYLSRKRKIYELYH